jgi:hypothetical protein
MVHSIVFQPGDCKKRRHQWEPQMKNRFQVAVMALLAGAAFIAEAGAAVIDQNGDYIYTTVRDNGMQSRTVSRHVNVRIMAGLSARIPEKLARIEARNEARIARGRGCNAGNGAADGTKLDQSGSGNMALIAQFGSNDNVSVAQNGMDNAAYTLQLGNNQQATTTQNGNHDLAVVIQRCSPARAWTNDARGQFERADGGQR